MATQDISIYRGDTASVICVVKMNGVAFDLTDYTMELNVKENYEKPDTDIIFTVSASIAIPTNGTGIFSLDTTHTSRICKKYVYDIKIYKLDAYNEPLDVKTLKTGYYIINNVVKREV